MAQELKKPTLEDLIPGGETYHKPENKSYQWWGDAACLELGIDNIEGTWAAKELERALNDMSWNPQKFAESTRYYHRTLQQELMKTIVAIIKMVGDKGYRTDLRNQASHELCRKIIDSGVLDDCYLPFI